MTPSWPRELAYLARGWFWKGERLPNLFRHERVASKRSGVETGEVAPASSQIFRDVAGEFGRFGKQRRKQVADKGAIDHDACHYFLMTYGYSTDAYRGRSRSILEASIHLHPSYTMRSYDRVMVEMCRRCLGLLMQERAYLHVIFAQNSREWALRVTHGIALERLRSSYTDVSCGLRANGLPLKYATGRITPLTTNGTENHLAGKLSRDERLDSRPRF
jgi:hypothetical protein